MCTQKTILLGIMLTVCYFHTSEDLTKERQKLKEVWRAFFLYFNFVFRSNECQLVFINDKMNNRQAICIWLIVGETRDCTHASGDSRRMLNDI